MKPATAVAMKPATAVAMKPAAVATMKPAAAPVNLRATMVGTAVAARDLPFNGTPALASLSLSPPANAQGARASVPLPPFVALAWRSP
jgi:hypothetical protein